MHCVQECSMHHLPYIFEKNKSDFTSIFPKDWILKIFGFLNCTELAKCGSISKNWRKLSSDKILWNAFDLKELFPSLKVFNKAGWQAHSVLSTVMKNVDEPPNPDRRSVILALKHLYQLPVDDARSGVTLFFIPQNLSLHALIDNAHLINDLEQNWLSGIYNEIFKKIGNIPVEKSYWIAMTKGVLKGSRKLSFANQKEFVNTIGCKMPTVLESTLFFSINLVEVYPPYVMPPSTRCIEDIFDSQLSVIPMTRDTVSIIPATYINDFEEGTRGVLRF
jgi:hypothetical protein